MSNAVWKRFELQICYIFLIYVTTKKIITDMCSIFQTMTLPNKHLLAQSQQQKY